MNNPDHYFDGQNDLLHYEYAADLAVERELATNQETGRIHHHEGPVWSPDGERIVREDIRHHLRNRVVSRDVHEVLSCLRAITSQPHDQIFDLPPEVLVVSNGTVNLITGEFSDGWNTPGTRTYLDIPFDPEAECPEFNEFLHEVLHPEDVKRFWEVIGLCLYRGHFTEKAILLLGDGANGKTVLMDIIRDFLGEENTASVSLRELSENKFARGWLEGKLANLAPDLDAKALTDTGRFKSITGGEKVQAPVKHKDPVMFRNYATPVFPANEMPRSPDETKGYRRRWLYFEFPNEFRKDDPDTLPQTVLKRRFEGEYPGILRRAVEAFGRLYERGHFEDTVFMDRYGDAAQEIARSPARRFIKQYMVFDGASQVRVDEAYTAYLEWAEDRDITTASREEFEETVEDTYDTEKTDDTFDARFDSWPGIRLDFEDPF